MKIERNIPPSKNEIQSFLKKIDFNLPDGFIDFFKEANGAEIYTDEGYLLLWTLSDMFSLNKQYNVDTFAPSFFLIGSNGGASAYAIEKRSGYLYQIPFIGMSNEEAIFICQTFPELLNSV